MDTTAHTTAMVSTGRTPDTTGPITGRIAMDTTIGPTIGMATGEGTGDIMEGTGDINDPRVPDKSSLTSAVPITALG